MESSVYGFRFGVESMVYLLHNIHKHKYFLKSYPGLLCQMVLPTSPVDVFYTEHSKPILGQWASKITTASQRTRLNYFRVWEYCSSFEICFQLSVWILWLLIMLSQVQVLWLGWRWQCYWTAWFSRFLDDGLALGLPHSFSLHSAVWVALKAIHF